jgi:putative aldouronate transport system substrate-binding protein
MFDATPVAAEAAALGTVGPEYADLCNGKRDDIDATCSEQFAKLDGAGYAKVMAELQRQVDEWKATRQG